MRVLLIVLIAFLAVARAEIVPRFPGVQPILVAGAPNSGIVPTSTTLPNNYEDKLSIDPFTKDTDPPVVIVLRVDVPPSISEHSFDIDTTILGGERDIILDITEGRIGAVFSAGASGGEFVLSTPSNGASQLQVQYDGRDGSINLDSSSGLGGIDLTTNSAQGFRLSALSDINTEFTVTIYDSENNVGTAFAEVEGSAGEFSYFIEFSLFDDTLNFQSINAISFEVQGFENVDFLITEFVTYGPYVVPPTVVGDCFSGVVLPCDTDYYRLQTFDDVQIGDYLTIEYYAIGENSHPDSTGRFYIVSSPFEDLQTELATNENIVDTLGALPGPDNYQFTCTDDCEIEIVWSNLRNATYYVAVEGTGPGSLVYSVCLAYNSVPVDRLLDKVYQPVFLDQRATIPPDDYVRHYHYYRVDVPQSRYNPGVYLRLNISRVDPFPGTWMGLMYESLPIKPEDTGIIGSVDYNSQGSQSDNHIYPYCVDVHHRPAGSPTYSHPGIDDPRVPCECNTEVVLFGNGPAYQLTCEIIVDPCAMIYGNWYVAVELPQRALPDDPLDRSGTLNYTIGATVEIPTLIETGRNVTYKSYVEPAEYTHFKVQVPANTIDDSSKFQVQISNIRNGFVQVFVHKGNGPLLTLAGGREGCSPANYTCTTCDACNIMVDKCHFSAGDWYISISIPFDEDTNSFLINDIDRLPITYTLRVNWFSEPEPTALVAGVPVSSYVGEALYNFYVIEVPPTIDTWLFVELYVKAEDTEVIISLLHGELPGGDCYARPDFYCMTGDPYEKRWSTGPPTFYVDEPVQRESCSFMIQTCELEAGPLFISVYGHHVGYAAYGDTTFYQVPAHYTLWADFDVALSLKDGVSYSETVFEKQYQHYYIRADRVYQGSWMSVEITNIRHGIPQTLEAYVNYQYLAGDCPCYDYLYNCTSTSPCRSQSMNDMTALPDVDTILNCCTIIVPASDFRPGVWYIAVLGVNEDLFQYTTPIGYTLTVTIHDAPIFNPLLLGQTAHGEVSQWNTTNEYTHYRLGAAAIPSNDLIVKVTFVQNCDFMGKHDDIGDSITVYLNKGAPANHYLGGWDYKCTANVYTQSYCTIVVPDCNFIGDDYFVAIKGDYNADFVGRFTIRAFTDEIRDIELTDGMPYYARVSEGRYKHFFISTTAEEDQYLAVDIYTNQDQDMISAYMNKDARAGDLPCHTNMDMCINDSMCSWQILACDMEPGRYYFSVYGHPGQFYDTSVEFTITVTHKPVAIQIFNGEPVTGHIWMEGQVQHYYIEVDELVSGAYLLFAIDNVKHGSVTVYGQKDYLAGRCPCFIYETMCMASGEPTGEFGNNEWCEIRIPTCELEIGAYYFSVWVTENATPDPPVFMTPVGYIVEADFIIPRFVHPTVVVGASGNFVEYFQTVSNERYVHYVFDWTMADFEAGYHLIVEVTNVMDGALFVYYNPMDPADEDCHLAQICTSGLGAGTNCIWQLPYCLVRPFNDTSVSHYITVEGKTGRLQAQYNILIYKEPVPSVTENDAFTLDTPLNSGFFPVGVELNATHSKFNEPNGWTQFIRLPNVPVHSDAGRGNMLELFFYRVQNNIGEPMDFNVYVNPKTPAGAHGCCTDETLGSCQEAPCSHSADTTVSINNGMDVFSHTCSFNTVGGGHVSSDPFYGERCTVRVWPCEFNKYCNSETVDWFVSVVPLAPTEPSTSGAGLTYSFQWRERDIRNGESISLNEFVNTYEFTREYTVTSTSTESEGWLSFHVDFNQPRSRFSIQTEFTQGSGIVYVNGDEFASDTDACHIYSCNSGEDCSGVDRFQVTECQSEYYQRYWVTIRNTGAVNSEVGVRFRLVAIEFPQVVEIPMHPTPENPYVTQSGPSINGIPGVEGSNYDFYYLIIDDDDLDNHNSWIVDVQRPVGADAGSLDVYIRFGVEPGAFYDPVGLPSSLYYNSQYIEGCGGYEYSCSLPTDSSRCTFQIPHCQMVEGYWYIGIHNPDFMLDSTSVDLPEYILSTYISNQPTPIQLNEQVVSQVRSDVSLLQHFSVNITADDLDFDPRESLTGFWTRYLRFQLDGIDLNGAVNLFINYDALAGPNGDSCLYNFDSELCSSGSCFIDVLPCANRFDGIDGNSLTTGVYYIAVQQVVPTDFALLVRVYRNEYQPLSITETLSGTGHRFGTTDILYRYTVTDTELIANGDGDGNYRYVIDEALPSDDLDDNEYIIFNITSSSLNDAGDSLNLEIWRDDCTRYDCGLNGPDSWCTIDALGLSPATAKAGRFFIRVENPSAMIFTLYYYRNQTTIQSILDRQLITEIVYPYEYQEYYYEAHDVGQGATLTVEVCSICGDVQAFIRADLPSGPFDVNHPEVNAAIDSCEATGPDDTTFVEGNNCCMLFLDTCEYQQRAYYIGIRGVNMVYPGNANPHLYLPIKYTVEPYQTTLNITSISPQCAKTVEYYHSWTTTPVQYAFDLETVNVGSSLRVSLRVPEMYDISSNIASVRIQPNSTVGYSSDSCPWTREDLFGHNFCQLGGDGYYGEYTCSFIVPYCDLQYYDAARYYIWADAPRGSEILIERYDPSVYFLHPNVKHSATINADSYSDWDLPYRPNVQYYRFDLDPKQDENYYEKFFLRLIIDDVSQGSLFVQLGVGNYPVLSRDYCGGIELGRCENVEDGGSCSLDVTYTDLKRATSRYFTNPIPKSFWVTVVGNEQQCELHSIKYSLMARTMWEITYYPIDETICNSVGMNEYNFHRLQPREVENPQQSVLKISITDLDDDNVLLILKDGYLPTENQNDFFTYANDHEINLTWFCGYQDLYLSVYGFEDANYRMSVEKMKVHIKEVYDDSIYYADDDDDDACPHEHDFYFFRTAQPLGHHSGSFLRVLVDSEFSTEVFVNKGTIGWGDCIIAGQPVDYGANNPDETGTTSVNVYDWQFSDGQYYITVVSDGPYYIYTDIRDDAIDIPLGAVYRDHLEPAEYQVYRLEICEDWFEADDRLVVEITDVDGGGVYGWIKHGSVPQPKEIDYPFDDLTDDGDYEDSTYVNYGTNEDGYGTLVIQHCSLQAGTYFILIRTSPHEGTPSVNLNKYVRYRLFPYLIDYNIDALEITPNTVVNDLVDYFAVNRINLEAVKYANYYHFMPLMEDQDYYEGISHAVLRLMNVRGGLLRMMIQEGHLAINNQAYIDGEYYGLPPTTDMQSSRYPMTKNLVYQGSSSEYQDECTGCSDFCVSMGFADGAHGVHTIYDKDVSAAIWLPSCYLIWSEFYIVVEPITQYYEDHSIEYELMVEHTRDYLLLQPNTHKIGQFENNNWDYDFYYSISAEPQSMRWRVVVTDGQGVLVTVRNHRCPLQATWVKEIWCDAAYYDRPWMCDIEIPTRAAHPGDNAYFVAVYGKNATYSVAFWRGRENCHEFTGAGRNEGLDFCAGMIPYATWRWDNYRNLDNEAECFFTELYEHFKCQPCWNGVSVECNATLRAFACYESFKRCDEGGFYTGTCRDSCDAVVYECANWFESVDLEHYNCTSSRYLDSHAGVCTGNMDFHSFNEGTQHFLGEDPDLILFKSSPMADSSSSASSLQVTIFSIMVVILVFLF